MRQATSVVWLLVAIWLEMFGELCGSKVDSMIRQYKWNQELVKGLEGTYEVVYPFQVRDKVRIGIDTRHYLYKNESKHYEKAVFVMRSSFGRFKLYLERNDQLVVNGASFKQVLQTGQPENSNGLPENCFYQGRVHNDPHSAVALSSCSGLRAVIFTHNETFTIIPLRGGDLGKRHPHLLFKSQFDRKIGCANDDNNDWSSSLSRKHATRNGRHRRDVQRSQKYLELAIVADYGLAKQMAFQFEPVVNFVLETVNIVDLMFERDLNTRVSLVYMEAWTEHNAITLVGDITQTLLNFIDYVSKEIYSEKKDATVFLTSHGFSRREASMAATGSVCTARAAGVVTSADQFQPHQTAIIMAHNIGHIMGMKHDHLDGGLPCQCSDSRGCLMRQVIGGKRYQMTPSFSTCSLEDLLLTLKLGQGRCLFNKPLEDDNLKMCGNKIIDEGEQCDCGSIEECDMVDPCCDPVTCKLKSFAQCASGPCCDNCQLKSAGHVCRSSSGDCDVMELCDGINGQCPSNAVKVNGAICGLSPTQGICFNGRCVSKNRQCIQLWGSGSSSAPIQCYERFNVLGVSHGHCGSTNGDKTMFKKCDLRNVGCGTLHCKGGAEAPIVSKLSQMSLKMQFVSTSDEDEHECKVVSDLEMGLIWDGTECSENGVCLSGACVPKEDMFPATHCPTNNLALQCSGHGVCTTVDKCFCNAGWTGDDCSQPRPTQHPVLFSTFNPDTTSENRYVARDNGFVDITVSRIDTSTMLIILGGVAGAIILLLLFLLLCYRRRTASDLRKKKMAEAARQEFERFSESSADTAQRSIKFGSMPSYRDEKRQRKKKRFIRDLHRINEASDERDSISNKSRDSGADRRTVSPEAPCFPPPAPPDRGILKNGGCNTDSPKNMSDAETFSPLLPAPLHLGGLSSGDAGYESEPVVYSAYRAFENSLRQLNECGAVYNPYHIPTTTTTTTTACVTGSFRTSPSKSDCCPSAQYYNRRSPRSNSSLHSVQPPLAVFSPQAPRATPLAHRSSRGGYATDTELGYTPRSARRRPSFDERSSCSPKDDTPPRSPLNHFSIRPSQSVTTPPRGSQMTEKTSPTGSVASSRGLGKPQPLKLRNIEFLLKQLDNASGAVSPTSSGEFSAPEAEKACEESSNTESHRDGNQMVDEILCHDLNSGISAPDGCLLESYDCVVFQNVPCNSNQPLSHESRPKDLLVKNSNSSATNAKEENF